MPMKFNNEQMLANLHEDADFAEWYVEDFMKKNLQNYYFAVSDEGKREMVINGRNYARRFGFNNPEWQFHFVTLMWKVAANFWQFPGFKEVAEDQKTPEEERIDQFYNLPKDLAVEAIMNPDERYWYPEIIEELRANYPHELRFKD
ncbi:hypothetical protein ACQU0X_29775 [Pseudovibrio ascidiaceicola]|uniref:hypothetical protein n=1 Tax=Pseudovibrio ascidiaceicola TaxID=285279 RepID=UPI003D36A312